MKTTLAMTASALAVLGYAESSISFAYDKDEVKEMWEGLSDQAKEGAEAVLLGYILLAADEEMTPGTIDDTMIPGGAEGEGAEEGEGEGEGNNLAQTGAGHCGYHGGYHGGCRRGYGGYGRGYGWYGGYGGYGGYGCGYGGYGHGCRRGGCYAQTGAETEYGAPVWSEGGAGSFGGFGGPSTVNVRPSYGGHTGGHFGARPHYGGSGSGPITSIGGAGSYGGYGGSSTVYG